MTGQKPELQKAGAAVDDLPQPERDLTDEQAEGTEGGLIVITKAAPTDPDAPETKFHWG